MRTCLSSIALSLLISPLAAHADNAPAPASAPADQLAVARFRVQEIDRSLKVGYAVKLVDINGDGKPDIVVVDSARVIWFENPGRGAGSGAAVKGDLPAWKLHTIIEDKSAGVKADNVCLDVADLDGDGKLDIVLGADWQPGNTKGGGSLQWLRQPKEIDQPWEVHPIFESEPTLHRIHFGDLDGSGKPVLVVGPLKGRESTPKANFMDHGLRLLAFPIPKDPAKDKWESTVLTDQLHVLHNFLPVQWDGEKGDEILTASYEGVNLLHKSADGKWNLKQIGAGNQDKPNGSRGSSEVKVGRLTSAGEGKRGGAGERQAAHAQARYIATVEPFHGNQAVVYTAPTSDESNGMWTRTVLDDTLIEGHGVWCADLDGDGTDEMVVGWRGGRGGIRVFKSGTSSASVSWQKHELDPGGVAVEDLACIDLNGDGRVDIVAVGRSTHNVRIYWNEGTPGQVK